MHNYYHKKTPPNTKSFLNGIKDLPVGYKIVKQWYDFGDLKQYLTYQNTKRFTDADLKRIKAVIEPVDMYSFQELKHLTNLCDRSLLKLMDQLIIGPVILHDRYKVSPRHDLYSKSQLHALQNQLLKDRQTISEIKLIPNTEHIYNYPTDYSIKRAALQLGLPSNQYRIFYNWINHHRIDGHYSIDNNGQIFFTPEQLTWLKTNYRHIPKNIYGGNQKLADHLHVTPKTIIQFRSFYQLPIVKILGYRKIYYTNETAHCLIDWYQNPKHRPYPYQHP